MDNAIDTAKPTPTKLAPRYVRHSMTSPGGQSFVICVDTVTGKPIGGYFTEDVFKGPNSAEVLEAAFRAMRPA